MITKMKKLTFLVYHKEYEEFLNSLRELGVVHIVEKQQGAEMCIRDRDIRGKKLSLKANQVKAINYYEELGTIRSSEISGLDVYKRQL